MTDVPFTGKSLLAKLTSNSIFAVSNSGSGFRWEPTNLTVADLNRALVGISGTTILADTNFSDQLIIFGASTFNITLPTAVANDGQIIESYDLIGSVGAHTFITTGGQTIDGNASRTIAAGEYISFVAYGGQWFTLISNVNPYTDAEKTKLNGIETLATADQTDSEIETAYNNQVAAASQVQMETGTEPSILRMSPLRVAQAIAALAVGEMSGPASSTDNEIARQNGTSGKIIQSYASGAPTISDIGVITTHTIPKLLENGITGASTAAANKHNILTGTTYTVTLPSAVTGGGAPERISFYCETSGVVTLDPTSTQTINGALTYAMAVGDYLLLESDGANWRILERSGSVFVYADSNAGQGLTSFVTDIQYEDNIIDSHQTWTGNNTFTAPRDGDYFINLIMETTGTAVGSLSVYINATLTIIGPGKHDIAVAPVGFANVYRLSMGDTVTFKYSHSETRSTSVNKNQIVIREIQ